MLLLSAYHRPADQCAENHVTYYYGIKPLSKPDASIESSTQIQLNSHYTKSPSSSSSSVAEASTRREPHLAFTNNLKGKRRTRSRSLPPSIHKSLIDFPSFSDEPPDTDPASLQALWDDVMSFPNGYYPSNPTYTNIMASSVPQVPHERFQEYQITVMEDRVVPTNPIDTYFSNWYRDAMAAAPTEEGTVMHDHELWEFDGMQAIKTKEELKAEQRAKAENLAPKFTALHDDKDSSHLDRQQFVTMILSNIAWPGVKVCSDYKMVGDDTSIPYTLLSTADITKTNPAPQSKMSTTISGARKVANSRTSASISATSGSQASQICPDPPAAIKLDLPSHLLDFSYWLDVSILGKPSVAIERQTFVSCGTTRKTSPYLSIAFPSPNSEKFTGPSCSSKEKIAIYGATALYNRRLLYHRVLQLCKTSSEQIERSACDVHFGLAFSQKMATLYMFQCKEKGVQGGKQDSRMSWLGCSMSKVGIWSLTEECELASMLDHLQKVADWVKGVYIPALRDDLDRLIV